ncbi:MAG: hypothetical protein AAGD11_01860 [Planctomycetota bacterium]
MNQLYLLASCLLIPTTAFAQPSQSASHYVRTGMERFRTNQIPESIADFQEAEKLDPRVSPYLWQLGISYYYAEKYQLGRQLFESHQKVNPDDVENAAWHFLCLAQLKGVPAARKQLLNIDTRRDARVPMSEVYDLYLGSGSTDAVLAAANQADTESARMYAHLYVGLYYEVSNKPDQARDHLTWSAAAKLSDNYMHDVAKVHLLQRQWAR